MTASITRLSHLGLCVAELDRSLRFYRDRLGFSVVSQIDVAGPLPSTLLQIENVELAAIYLERDGFRLELLSYKSPGTIGTTAPRAMNALGLTHLSFRVEDLASLLADLRRNGIQVLDASLIDLPDFGVAAAFITDPDGTLIELVQSPGDPALLPGQTTA